MLLILECFGAVKIESVLKSGRIDKIVALKKLWPLVKSKEDKHGIS